MRVVVLGAGAIGSLFGALLSKENDVTLICRKEQALAIQKNGLKIQGKTNIMTRPDVTDSVTDCKIPDVLFITVKSYDTEKVIQEAKTLVSEETVVVSVQNGLGNLQAISTALNDAKVVGGLTSHGAILVSPGIVEHAGFGDTVAGAFSGCGKHEAEAIARMLTDAGIETSITVDINREVWYKALINAAINPLATLANSPNGVLLEDKDLKKLAGEIVSEGVRVAAAQGISLNREKAFSRVLKVASQTAENRNSMLQDLERGKRTEIDQINGAIARLGAAVGIDTPINIRIITQIKDLETIA